MPLDMRESDLYEKPREVLGDKQRELSENDARTFPYSWLWQSLFVELLRYSTEREWLAIKDAQKSAFCALTRLASITNWIHPYLVEFLDALRTVAFAKESPPEAFETMLTVEGRPVPVLEFQPTSGAPFRISNKNVERLVITERNASNPAFARSLAQGLARLLRKLAKTRAVTHLIFVEKQMGFVGPIVMLSDLVGRTGLRAAIYREDRWTKAGVLATDPPPPGSRAVILHDLFSSGRTISDVTDFLSGLGVDTVAAITICGIGEPAATFDTEGERRIDLYALKWYPEVSGINLESSLRSPGEAPTRSASRVGLREDDMREIHKPPPEDPVPPGSYDLKALPEQSAEDRLLYDEVIGVEPAPGGSQALKDPNNGQRRIVGVMLERGRTVGLGLSQNGMAAAKRHEGTTKKT